MIAAPGCYRAHERDAPDGGPSCGVDRVDASIVRPVTQPPDDAVAFTIEGESVVSADAGGGVRMRLVLGRDALGMSWRDRFVTMALDGTVDGSATALSSVDGLAFGGGRFALTAHAASTQLLFFDEHARSAASPADVRTDRGLPADRDTIDVAWLASRGAFVAVGSHGSTAVTIDVQVVGTDGRRLETLRADPAAGISRVRIAATDRYALVIVQQPTHVLQGLLLGGDPVAVLAGPFDLLVNDDLGNAIPSVFAYGDRFLVTGFDGHEVRVSSVSPADCGAVRVQPRRVASTRLRDQPAGVAVAPERGFYAVCFVEGAGPTVSVSRGANAISIQAVGEDGTPWGRPFSIATGLDLVDGVDCAWDGHDVMVVWSLGCDGSCDSSTHAARLRPTFL